jgi:lipopolysaccharide transport system permease protein
MYLHPIIVTVTFMLVFGTVLGTRLSVTADIPGDYTSYILVGLVPWFFTAYLLGRGPSVFTSNSNLVKQVVFPIEILPTAAVIVSCIIYAPTFLLFLIYKLTLGGGLPLSALLAPVTLGLHALLALGVTMALAVLTPFLKDIREIVTVYSGISMYFTPAVYLPDWVPAILRPIIYLNPFSYVVWVYQDTFFFGEIAHPFAWIVLAMLAFAAFFGGLFLMDRLKPYLGNVI